MAEHRPPITSAPAAGSADDLALDVRPQLRTRVVREARRETWFVVNEAGADLVTIPLPARPDAGLRRAEVNGEASAFTTTDVEVLVQPRKALRPGAGTIVVLHFR
jgi:hypothetical protein